MNPGVVADLMEDGNDAWIAGLRPGDVILAWSRGDESGDLATPFDLMQVETRQKPRGTVTMRGTHEGQPKSWTLGHDFWYLEARPNFSAETLPLYEEAINLVKKGDVPGAQARWNVIAEKLSSSEQAIVSCWFYYRAGRLQTLARKWADADIYFEKASALAPPEQHMVLAYIANAWGNAYGRRNDLEKAKKLFEHGLEETRKLGPDDLSQASNLASIGSVWLIKGSPEQAENYFQAALDVFEKSAPQSVEQANMQRSVAVAAEQRGDLGHAEMMSRKASVILDKLAPGDVSIAALYLSLGSINLQRGDIGPAEDYYRKSITLHQTIGARGRGLMIGMAALGSISAIRGDLATAEANYQEALTIAKEVDASSYDPANLLTKLAFIAQKRGDFARAEELNQQAFKMAEKLDPNSETVAQSLAYLGELKFLRGDAEGAQLDYEKALAVRRRNAPHTLATAKVLSDLGEAAEATGDLQKAEHYHREALALREELAPASTSHAESLAFLAGIARKNGHQEEAMQLFAKALDALDNQAARLGGSNDVRAGYRASHDRFYRDYISLLVSRGEAEQALQVVERFRGRAMLELLQAARMDLRHGADNALLEQEHSLEADIAAKSDRRSRLLGGTHSEDQIKAIETEISRLNKEYEDTEGRIQSANPDYAALTHPHSLDLKAIQQLLDRDTVLLEYSLGDRQSYLFAVTTESLHTFELPARAEIEKPARQAYTLLKDLGRGIDNETTDQRSRRWSKAEQEFNEGASQLSGMLLTPASSLLQKKRLIIVADGALNYIPFAALPDPVAGTPVTLSHEVVNLPSASVLALLRKQEKQRVAGTRAIAVLADPVFDRNDPRIQPIANPGSAQSQPTRESRLNAHLLAQSTTDLGMVRGGSPFLERLPYTRREADNILSLMKGLKAVDFKASRAAAMDPMLGQYRMVHFATHGLVNGEHPELSGLVLSLFDEKGQPENGFLRLQDIYNMHLSADLVVLSACETGLGKEVSGEGLVGLSRGFMYAGASRVVASLWKVSDAATAELMSAFYRGMERDHLPASAALREAQLDVMRQKRWRSPYYWAAFQIQGDWK